MRLVENMVLELFGSVKWVRIYSMLNVEQMNESNR